MVNICQACGKVIDEGEDVTMLIQGTYRRIESVKTFALYKDVKFIPGTLSHTECEGESEWDE